MSTRCQIGFYKTPIQSLEDPNVLLYRHSDGYPDEGGGVLAALVPWTKYWAKGRGLEDVEYAAARGLVALIRAAGELENDLGYGICGDKALHGDIEYYYRVDPSGVTVYKQPGEEWTDLHEVGRTLLDTTQQPTP